MDWHRDARRTGWVVVVVIACLLVLATPALGYSITGTVTAFGTGQPVKDCELQMWYLAPDGTSWYRLGVYAEPAADGSYSLNFSEVGKYRVQCYNSPTYAEQWWHEVATPDLAMTITVPGDVLTGIDFSLRSNKPAARLSLTAPAACAYGSVSLTGSLTDSGGQPLTERTVRIESSDGNAWMQAGSATTDAAGAYSFKAAPTSTTTYRAVFDGDMTHDQATSTNAQVTPKVSLSKPVAPKTARTTTTFSVTCVLKPHHQAGTYALTFECRHYERGKWVLKKTLKAKAADVTGGSKCSARVRLTLKGSWRIVAVHKADVYNASTTSARRVVAVK